jgi:hypothetical protein
MLCEDQLGPRGGGGGRVQRPSAPHPRGPLQSDAAEQVLGRHQVLQ